MEISVNVVYKLGGSYGYQSLYTSLCASQTHTQTHGHTHIYTCKYTHTLKSDIGTLEVSGVGTAQLVECPTQKPGTIPM